MPFDPDVSANWEGIARWVKEWFENHPSEDEPEQEEEEEDKDKRSKENDGNNDEKISRRPAIYSGIDHTIIERNPEAWHAVDKFMREFIHSPWELRPVHPAHLERRYSFMDYEKSRKASKDHCDTTSSHKIANCIKDTSKPTPSLSAESSGTHSSGTPCSITTSSIGVLTENPRYNTLAVRNRIYEPEPSSDRT